MRWLVESAEAGLRRYGLSILLWLAAGVFERPSNAAATPDPGPGPGAADAARPNLVLIIADDLGAEDVGAFGNTAVRTPHLNRLAREGMRFERAILTCSSCSPSRASLITSRYPHNTGAERLHMPLPREQVTFVEQLKAAGYFTAAVGKWHLGPQIKDRFDLTPDDFPLTPEKRQALGTPPAPPPTRDGSGCEFWVTALRARPKDKPFFFWLASIDPHRDYQAGTVPEPHPPATAVVPPYLPATPVVRQDLARYYDEIARLDRYVGAVLEELHQQGVARDTLILFLSDNGRPFPRCKTTVYDSGIRTPLIVRWPERVPAGAICQSLVSSIDVAPTLLELAGLAAPPSFEGKSFSALLRDPKATIREQVFAEHNWHDYAAHERAVRTRRFKYIRNAWPDLPGTPPADAVRSPTFQEMRKRRGAGQLTPEQMTCFSAPRSPEELYDLQNDPHELKSLAGDPAHAPILRQLRERLAQWQRETGDTVPSQRPEDGFDRETGIKQ